MNAPDHAEFVPLTEAAFARLQIALYRYRLRTAGNGLEEARKGRPPPTPECPHCNPTAKAIRRVQDQWVVAGIE